MTHTYRQNECDFQINRHFKVNNELNLTLLCFFKNKRKNENGDGLRTFFNFDFDFSKLAPRAGILLFFAERLVFDLSKHFEQIEQKMKFQYAYFVCKNKFVVNKYL